MARGDRRWRWVRVVGSVVSIVFAALYYLSVSRVTIVQSSNNRDRVIALYRGGFGFMWDIAPPLSADWGWVHDRGPSRYHVEWWLDNYQMGIRSEFFIPAWMPLLALSLPTAYAWRRCRRFPPGHCRKCGYDLTGNTTGVCPECGTAFEAKRGAA